MSCLFQIAIYGRNFCTATKDAFMLIMRNVLRSVGQTCLSVNHCHAEHAWVSLSAGLIQTMLCMVMSVHQYF